MNIDEWKRLLLGRTGQHSVRSLALAVGMEPSTLARQMRTGLPAETLIDICRHFGIEIVPMMVEGGYLTPEEAHNGDIRRALREATDHQLMLETLRRVQAGSASSEITDPIDVGGSDEDYDVSPEALKKSDLGLASKRGTRKVDAPHAD
ncbi:hypothetical protein AS850_02975 [Frondihabitans sp. 762G35]|uniref:hypothetical protein n=1 Tax=Frondihabitans sp. 762G35 TaxID=1446794 RepID=UPI000D22CA3B|nr:hypothetical protein [Frondihabitans sp. 762G35]ARC56036.1 hypothetical protein AS850_02975 [Frondihabitans sp. 762G35]